MLQKELVRKNVFLKDGVLSIFSCRGFQFGVNSWYISLQNQQYFFRIAPFSPSKEIEKYIEESVSLENLHNLKSINISSEKALCLYLEGKITEVGLCNGVNNENIVVEAVKFQVHNLSIQINLVINPY